MDVEIKYNYRDTSNKLKKGILTYADIIEAILYKDGIHISSVSIYKAKVGE